MPTVPSLAQVTFQFWRSVC